MIKGAGGRLPVLPNWERFTDRVTTVLGLNPGPFTLTGTNTYLVGTGKRRILIDTGEGKEGYIENLETAMREVSCEGLQEIVLTHWHRDHTGGVEDVLRRFGDLKVSKFPDPHDQGLGLGVVFHTIEPGQLFRTEGATLRALHTPGHTEDHLCFILEEEKNIFGGDCVLGIGTAVFEDLHTYMASLDKILLESPNQIYSSHGPKVEDASEKVKAYITHRNSREAQIVKTLDEHAMDRPMGSMDLVKRIYIDTPEHLHPAAQNNVLHHLSKLVKDGVVVQVDTDSWAPASSTNVDSSQASMMDLSENASRL